MLDNDRSTLSVGALVEHATYVMVGVLARPSETAESPAFDPAAIAAIDPGAELVAPPESWHGIFDARPIHARFYLVHQIEELARHAGHADIIREQIDGVAVPALVLTREGFAGNDVFQPFVAAEGTLT